MSLTAALEINEANLVGIGVTDGKLWRRAEQPPCEGVSVVTVKVKAARRLWKLLHLLYFARFQIISSLIACELLWMIGAELLSCCCEAAELCCLVLRFSGSQHCGHVHCAYQYREHYHCMDPECNYQVSVSTLSLLQLLLLRSAANVSEEPKVTVSVVPPTLGETSLLFHFLYSS